MKNYNSSITTKYGDVENVKSDVKTLNEILGRQGTSLLIDVIASYVGEKVIRYKINHIETTRLVKSLVAELNESLLERT